ncbi:MAG: DUF1707 and DUF2154 domain-containing protein [Spirochaetaceae bacterium]|nr:MAG: DUF1707 and DUF2154 domain-containing protein [Spirochaetaceae bacterium]
MSDRSDLREDSSGHPQRRSVVGLPAKRERTIRILSECFAKNILEMEEFERRISLAHQARSVQDLARLIDDIPGDLAEAPEEVQKPASSKGIVLREDEQPVYGIMMSRRLRGQWLKCRTVNARTLMSSLEFDFRDLDLPSDIVEINVLALMSSVVVTVPEELPVQLEVVPILGEVKEGRRVKTALPKKGPGVRISGFIMMGDVKVRAR